MKLLTVGQSVKEGKTVLGKYKPTHQALLPKFGATAREMGATTLSADTSVETISGVASDGPAVVGKEMSTRQSVSRWDKTQRISIGQVLRRVEKAPGMKTSLTERIKTKVASVKVKFLSRKSRKNTFSKVVQTEWTLEKVKVARNDLSDADIEVISRKPALPQAPRPTGVEAGNTMNSGREWIKMTTRLFKSTSPFQDRSEKHEIAMKKCDSVELVEKN